MGEALIAFPTALDGLAPLERTSSFFVHLVACNSSSVKDRFAKEVSPTGRGARWGGFIVRRIWEKWPRPCAGSTYLDDSAAFAQLLWWSEDTEPEAPPDVKAKVVAFMAAPPCN